MVDEERLRKLRTAINENLRVQKGGADPVPYIDAGNALTDIVARQNHAVFARRGCGKTLLLHDSAGRMPPTTRCIYLNCEDFKNHSFPNVLIEILDSVFGELEANLTGWFGRKKASREIIQGIRTEFGNLKSAADERTETVKEGQTVTSSDALALSAKSDIFSFSASATEQAKASIEREYERHDSKLQSLNLLLPTLKKQIRGFFELSSSVDAVFIQLDDFYHLKRVDQPHVIDYVHRLCKDVPLYFKVATLRHATTLYVDREGQPTGAQERHDYQPINTDFTFQDFQRTENQIRRIFYEFGRLVGISEAEMDGLFKGDGFSRLILAGGGVPRDCLSLFLEVLEIVQATGDGRIGKDDVRQFSAGNFQRRIEELKEDSEQQEQGTLLKGIHVLRTFCLDKKTNVFLIDERVMQEHDNFRQLIYRLLDYRIIHSLGSAITHKSQPGTFHGFAIDVGAYAQMRQLAGRFNEIDPTETDAREKIRSAPILTIEQAKTLWTQPEAPLKVEEPEGE